MSKTLQQTRVDGSHLKTLARMAKGKLLIIEGFLLTPPAGWEHRNLMEMEIVEDRYRSGATVPTCSLS